MDKEYEDGRQTVISNKELEQKIAALAPGRIPAILDEESNMTSFKRTSLADKVFEKLENDIIFGVYPRGEILTELKLVEQLGVSRTPIREALRRREQERLIDDTG